MAEQDKTGDASSNQTTSKATDSDAHPKQQQRSLDNEPPPLLRPPSHYINSIAYDRVPRRRKTK